TLFIYLTKFLSILLMSYFNPDVIQYDGPNFTIPYSVKYYNPIEKLDGKTMEEILRFGVAYWHTFTTDLSDPFGVGTAVRDWDSLSEMDKAKARVDAIL